VAIRPILEGIPDELKARDQWALWWYQLTLPKGTKPGRWTKPPFIAGTGRRASTTDPKTWRSFETAITYGRVSPSVDGRPPDGIGYMFAPDDPYTGVDLDKCRDPVTGEIKDWARELIDLLDTYCEVSPSGTGVKLILRGKLNIAEHKRVYGDGVVEVYDRDRFFTLTGVRP
jgi:primase-polymerase (primpol)-like protein